MVRFIHTADWQIGMRTRGLGAAAAEAVRGARLKSIQTVLQAAAEHRVDAVLVGGDCFEDNGVADALVEQVAALLNAASACPIYLIPGNHDPLTPGSVWQRPIWRQLRAHVRPLLEAKPIGIAPGVTLFPCPLTAKHGGGDPTAWIPPRAGGDNTIRIGLAHGTMRIRPDLGDDDFPVPIDAAARRDLDYLALGHWHSTLASPCRRAWYSGTHETTAFGERQSGRAMLVTIDAAGAMPVVTLLNTGQLIWIDSELDLAAESADALLRRFREQADADRSMIRLALRGVADPPTAATLAQLRELLSSRFIHHDVDASALRPPAGDATNPLSETPQIQNAAAELRELVASGAGSPNAAVATRALEILAEAAWAARQD